MKFSRRLRGWIEHPGGAHRYGMWSLGIKVKQVVSLRELLSSFSRAKSTSGTGSVDNEALRGISVKTIIYRINERSKPVSIPTVNTSYFTTIHFRPGISSIVSSGRVPISKTVIEQSEEFNVVSIKGLGAATYALFRSLDWLFSSTGASWLLHLECHTDSPN